MDRFQFGTWTPNFETPYFQHRPPHFKEMTYEPPPDAPPLPPNFLSQVDPSSGKTFFCQYRHGGDAMGWFAAVQQQKVYQPPPPPKEQVVEESPGEGNTFVTSQGLPASANAQVHVSDNAIVYMGTGGPKAQVRVAQGTNV